MKILELNSITKSFGGVKAVDNATLSFTKGKITSLIGPNGAGKSTIFHLVTGFLKIDSGSILYKGETINNLQSWQIAKRGIGRLFQDIRVFNKLTCFENVLIALSNDHEESPYSFVTRFNNHRPSNVLKNEAKKWLDFVGLQDKESHFAESLSFGQQKLLAIARLMAGGFDVILLDEPTAGVNPVMIKEILSVIQKLADEGKTPIIIEHNMNVVLEISDWVWFMDEGKIVSFGLPEDVLGNQSVKEAYIGL